MSFLWYPMKGMRTPAKYQRIKQACGLFLVLGLIAVLMSSEHFFGAHVTISGLSLSDHRTRVHSILSAVDFRCFEMHRHTETWHRMDTPSTDVSFGPSETARKIQGGIPQINGQDVRHWTLQEVREALGPPQHASKGREVERRQEARNNLSYPQHRLLIQEEKGEIRFILFASGRDS